MSPQSTASDVQYIKLPDGSYGKFRADAADTDIMAQIEKDFPGTYRPGIPRPQVNMEGGPVSPSLLDSLSAAGRSPLQPTAQDTKFYQEHPGLATGAGLGGIAAGTAAATAPTTLPFLGRQALSAGKGLAKGLPWLIGNSLLSKGIQYARTNLPGGKFLPPGAELLPFLMPRQGGGAEPEEEPGTEAGSTDQVPGRPYKPDPRYEPPPEPEAIPPRDGPLLLNGEVQQPAPVTRKQVSSAVDDSLGVQPRKPNEPIYKRPPFLPQASDTPAVPEGHTAFDSSVLNSGMYDPQENELHVTFNDNPKKVHVFGDVNPQEGQEFMDASSKGKAFQKIKKGSYPRVATIINGKRTATPPGAY